MTPLDTHTHSQSTTLTSTLLSAATPSQITAAISAVSLHLSHHSPDQTRHFFSLSFPSLLLKLFGFHPSPSPSPSTSPPSWVHAASLDPTLSTALSTLLSPAGPLLTAILALDKLSLIKFVFPLERLPHWLRLIISTYTDSRLVTDICPLLKGRVIDSNVHLNVFEYYMFWFAYYPLSRGAVSVDYLRNNSVKNSSKFRLEKWIMVSGGGGSKEQKKGGGGGGGEGDLYLRLLAEYLRAFVPIEEVSARQQPYRSSILHYSGSYDDSVVLRAEFVVSVLVHYWLVDNDFSPLAVNVCKSLGVSFPFRSVLGEMPPAAGLGEVVKVFVKYLNLSAGGTVEGEKRGEGSGSGMYKRLGSGDFGKAREVAPWNAYIQRPLYRFILRTFLFCPMGSSMKNISEVFSVWIEYIEPWKISKEEFAEFDTSSKGSGKESGQSSKLQYSQMWQGYVVSNYLFYTSLVMHFIGFAHKFLHTDPEVIVRMVSKVIDILTSSRELLELIKNVDTVFHSKNAGSAKSMLNSLSKFVPQICEQLQDWEDGLSESDADGSFLHENWNRDLRLFSDGEDGGPQLLQLFILRAETELQAISGHNLANNLQCLQSLKSQLHCSFGDHVVKQSPASPGITQPQQSREELFKPRRVGNGSIANVKYKGDWLRRPISDDEVAWLAKLLIQLSNWLNESLGLYQGGSHSNGSCSYVEVPSDVMNEYSASDSLKVMMASITSWLLSLRLATARLMIRHGLKVNLRVFASKKFVTMVLVFAMFSMLRRAFRSIW